MRQTLAPVLLLVALVSCSRPNARVIREDSARPSTAPPSVAPHTETPSGSPGRDPTQSPTEGRLKDEDPGVVVVRYMLVRRTGDPATEDFEEITESTLEDPRGWQRAGFDLVRQPRARFKVVLAEGRVVDRLCLPYETYGTYSCQNGPVVALNAERWRTATDKWTGTLAGYKRMLVNHEVGHLLGQHHPEIQCPHPGEEAPIMAQQSTELNGCLPNPWPLAHEIRRAARHDLPLAPPYDPDV